jgi:hypothetical protein
MDNLKKSVLPAAFSEKEETFLSTLQKKLAKSAVRIGKTSHFTKSELKIQQKHRSANFEQTLHDWYMHTNNKKLRLAKTNVFAPDSVSKFAL